MKLKQALELYLDMLYEERQASESHIVRVRYRLGDFIEGRDGVDRSETAVSSISGEDIHRHFLALADEGLASGNLAGYKSAHRSFWSWCISQGWCEKDPSRVLSRQAHNYSFRPVNRRAASADDYQAVLDCLPHFAASGSPRDIRDALIVSLAADSAKRRGELWKLRRKDAEKALANPHFVGNGRFVYHIGSRGKTGQVTVRFFNETADLMRQWLEHIPPKAVFLFCSLRSGERLRLDYMGSAFKRVCKFAGVPVFSFQATRKRAVTDIIKMTGDMKAGQLLAGHASIRTTQQHYNDIEEASIDEAAAKMVSKRRGKHKDPLADAFFQKLLQ